MNDWNGNGKYDISDKYVDYRGTNFHGKGTSSDWWIWVLLGVVACVCPPIGIIIFIIIILISGK